MTHPVPASPRGEHPVHTEPNDLAHARRTKAALAWAAGGGALAVFAALPALPYMAERRTPTADELTRAFSAEWGSCFGADPTTAEAQELYGPFVVDGTTVRIVPRHFDEETNTWVLRTNSVSMQPDGQIKNGTKVFHYDSASGQFYLEVPTSYLTGNMPCGPETPSGTPHPTPQPAP